MNRIQKIDLDLFDLEPLRREAQSQGYSFLDTLVQEWASGTRRFSGPGETLCGFLDNGQLIAVGGLTIDPYLKDSSVGRIRRVYVRSAWRNRGIGKALVLHLVEEARKSFQAVRLRAENTDAARLYERLGFHPVDSPDATHILQLDKHH